MDRVGIAVGLPRTRRQDQVASTGQRPVVDAVVAPGARIAPAHDCRALLGLQRWVGNRAATMLVQRQAPADPAVKHPEKFPTYEGWLASFDTVSAFTSNDQASTKSGKSLGDATSHLVLGDPNRDKNAARGGDPKNRPADFIEPQAGDAFIDHPTDDWVKANLPEELRQTAYRLPANCADIVVILRHVWLFKHGRSENYRGFVVGFVPGESEGARSKRVGRDIAGISTATLPTMINPYSDAAGRPLRSVVTLAPLLHPGDILLWAHRENTPLNGPRSGGHSQTIVSITRAGGGISKIATLQGNEPLPKESGETLRHTPGRRVERREFSTPKDLMVPGKGTTPAEQVWDFGDGNTTLVMAGPPKSGERAAAKKERGSVVRHLADWIPVIAQAPPGRLVGLFEASAREAQAMLERGDPPAEVEGEARAVAASIRNRLADIDAKLAATGKPADPTQRATIRDILNVMKAGTTSTAPAAAVRVFGAVAEAFEGTVPQPGWSGTAPGDPNSGERLVGHVRRVPVDGLPATATKAIVALPAAITGGKPAVDVVLLFHGQNEGYRGGPGGRGGGQPGDITTDRIEQQLADTGRRMMAVLPQGTSKADFGPLDPDAYLTAVFSKLTAMKIWSPEPPRGSLVLAAHSGGGRTAAALATSGLVPSARQLALFDGINGPDELSAIETWILGQLDNAADRLVAPTIKGNPTKEDAVLNSVVRFRAYHSGSATARPDRSKKPSGQQPNWPGLHTALRASIDDWFTRRAAGMSPHAAAELRTHIEVIATGERNHHHLVGTTMKRGTTPRGALQDALTNP